MSQQSASNNLRLQVTPALLVAFVGSILCIYISGSCAQHHGRIQTRALRTEVLIKESDVTSFNYSTIVLVGDAGVKGNQLPPQVTFPLLTDAEMLEPPTHEYMAMCLVTSESGPEVREWIDHYLRLGVRKFYVYDSHNGTVLPAVKDLHLRGIVEYHAVPDKHRPWRQFAVYELCLQHRRRHQWLAFFDSDEYLMIKQSNVTDLPSFLKPYEAYGGVSVNWRVFGTSGHLQNPTGHVLDNYVQCTTPSDPVNDHVKTIANARHVVSHGNNPHVFVYREGSFPVNEHMREIYTGPGTSRGAITVGARSADILELYHFTSKSRNHYYKKLMRGSVNKTPYKTIAWYQDLDASCTAMCNETDVYMANRTLPTFLTSPLASRKGASQPVASRTGALQPGASIKALES